MSIDLPIAGQHSTRRIASNGHARLHDTMTKYVEEDRLPGLVELVALGDDVHVHTVGTPSLDDDTPLGRDAIFRIASLTKPVTAIVTMSLVEEGRLRLDEPIDDLVPELSRRRVLRSIDAQLDDTVLAKRPITRRGPPDLAARFRIRDRAARQPSDPVR